MPDAVSDARRLRKSGREADALALLHDALRRPGLSAADHERAGRLLQAAPEDAAAAFAASIGAPRWRVHLLGQCTTSWLAPVLAAVSLGRSQPLRVREADYDSVLQQIQDGDPADVLVLLPWTQRLLADNDLSEAERISAEIALWESAWALRRGARIVQIGYDRTGHGPSGALLGHRARLIRRANDALREALQRHPGSVFVDLEAISGDQGRERFYDPRRYHWTKQPFSEDGTLLLARHIQAAVRALTTGPKKVLVLDLDNTLWGGVVGELGPLGVALGESPDGEAFRAFQRAARDLSRRGVLLAVASKNNDADAREPFVKHPDMVLRLSDIAAFQAHWEPKSTSLQRIARDLNLGLDSLVFFDDNPVEREQIRQALPAVEVIEVPDDPAAYVAALEQSLLFETASVTAEDAARSAQYQAELQRREEGGTHADLPAYLRSLGQRADLREIDDADMQRVVQLLGKTNQFNLTTRRHSEQQILEWRNDPRAILLSLRAADRFGDHGLVAVLLGVPVGEDVIYVDTFLMSCRVIGRTVEQFLWGEFLRRAKAKGFVKVRAEYLPTAKNGQVEGLYEGFGLSGEEREGGKVYEGEIEGLPEIVSYIG